MAHRGSAGERAWYKRAVMYELPIKAFYDSTADGVGDLPGLLEKLDYLEGLGITCLHLLPFFPSPLRDDGYDIAEYCDVHPRYGTLDDMGRLVRGAHQRRMQVIIELVVNHTSDQHPWFLRAREAPAGSSERDFYVWSDTDERYRGARIIFSDTERSNWTWDPVARAYYWHRFFPHEPDLNYDNPAVVREILRVIDFWLALGIDGLRLGGLTYLVEREGTTSENLAGTHEVIKTIRRQIDANWPGRVLLADASQSPAGVRAYFGDGDECHMAYQVPLVTRMLMALHLEDRRPIVDIMAETPPIPDDCQWVLFLRSHDELALDLLTEEERDYMQLAYSVEPQAQVRLGIRRRLAPLLGNNRRRVELFNSLLFSFPGTPVVYYGDEIGMGDNVYLGDRNSLQTPMQWTNDRNARFSRADPARLYSPVVMDPIYGYQGLNVEAQERDASSLLQWMRNLIGLRKLFPVLGTGLLRFLDPANHRVLAYVREDGNDAILCVANLSRSVQPVELDLTTFAGFTPIEVLGYTEFPVIDDRPYFLTLGPYGFYWFELQRRNG